MNINQIEGISPLLIELGLKPVSLKKTSSEFKIDNVSKVSDDVKKYPKHEPKSYYDMMQHSSHKKI